jgi:RNA recognition motif. (a.k.a. RRM, RBD, or RNP domain)
VQTFVLAQQPTGYFVLNDIFRYINEEVEEEVEPPVVQEDTPLPASHNQPVEDVKVPKADSVDEEQKPSELDTSIVDKKLEESIDEALPAYQETQTATSEDAPKVTQTDVAEEALVVVTEVEQEAPNLETVEKALEEETKEPEKPKEPVPTPEVASLPSASKPAPAQPTQPPAPAKPMSWANRAAAAAAASAPRPAISVPKPVSPSPPQARAPPATNPTQATTPTPASQPTPTAKNNKENEAPPQAQGTGWQTAGGDHTKRQNRPQSVSGPIEKDVTMGYVRNVTEGVGSEELRATLSSYGDLIYFDINRTKVRTIGKASTTDKLTMRQNCAFVEFATIAGYQAAIAANPHLLGGEQIIVEPRRPKSSAYGGSNYNAGRGGMNGRGRGGFDQGRTPSQRSRGDFGPNRGRGGAPRGRGNNQPTST